MLQVNGFHAPETPAEPEKPRKPRPPRAKPWAPAVRRRDNIASIKAGPKRPRGAAHTILNHVCSVYALSELEMTSRRRCAAVSKPRQTAMWLMKRLTELSYPDIGRLFGDMDHTTVIHAVNVIESGMAASALTMKTMLNLEEECKALIEVDQLIEMTLTQLAENMHEKAMRACAIDPKRAHDVIATALDKMLEEHKE